MGLKELKDRITKTDKDNLALFLSMESDQFIAAFLSLAATDKQDFVLGSLAADKQESVRERIELITQLNEYALNLIKFGLDTFNKRFPHPNYPLK